MLIAGIELEPALVTELALLLDDLALEVKLRHAAAAGEEHITLEIAERETILAALENCPEGLGRLRAVLLQEPVARARGEMA